MVQNRVVKDASCYLRNEQLNPPCDLFQMWSAVVFFINDVHVDWNVPCISYGPICYYGHLWYLIWRYAPWKPVWRQVSSNASAGLTTIPQRTGLTTIPQRTGLRCCGWRSRLTLTTLGHIAQLLLNIALGGEAPRSIFKPSRISTVVAGCKTIRKVFLHLVAIENSTVTYFHMFVEPRVFSVVLCQKITQI